MPHGTDVVDKTGAMAIQLADLKSRIDYLEKAIAESSPKIEEYIMTIDNTRVRLMLRFRYVQGMTWNEITTYFGEGYCDGYCKNTCYDYMKKYLAS